MSRIALTTLLCLSGATSAQEPVIPGFRFAKVETRGIALKSALSRVSATRPTVENVVSKFSQSGTDIIQIRFSTLPSSPWESQKQFVWQRLLVWRRLSKISPTFRNGRSRASRRSIKHTSPL